MPSKKEKKEAKIEQKLTIGDIKEIVIDLAKKGNSTSQIGIILKEKYGVYDIKILGTKISKILKESQIPYKNDLDFVSEKLSKIEKHFEKNKQDKRAKREIVRFVSKKKKLKAHHNK